MTLNEWNMFADLAEQCKEAMCSSINVASKVRSEAVIAAYGQLQTQQAAILYVRDSLLQFGYAATEKNLHLDAKFNDALQLLDGCGMVLDIALTKGVRMNYKRIALTLKNVRQSIERGCGLNIGQVSLPASDVLEDVARAFALSNEEVAEVLGLVEERESATLTVPILGDLTGGAEDEAMWARVHAFFGGDVDPPTELPLHPDAAELPQYDNVSCDCGLCAGTNGTL